MSASLAPDMRRLYARVAYFPDKMERLRDKIAAMRDEAEELGFREEARQLAAMCVFAEAWKQERTVRLVNWTGEEVLSLKRQWLEGIPVADIAEHLNRTPAAVQKAARKHNLPLRRRRAA